MDGSTDAVGSWALTGGRVHTMDRRHPTADTIVVDGEIIVAVGGAELLAQYPEARIVETAGRNVLPGLIDAHTHLCIAALHPRWADLSAVGDFDGLREALGTQAASESEASWVRGVGWSDLEHGFSPTRQDLDALGMDRPIIAVHYSYHQAVVSSAGLDALGINEGVADPPGGAYGRDAAGRLNGVLIERAFSVAHERSMEDYRDPDRWGEHIEAAARAMLADGVTCVHDAACPPSAERVYRELASAGRLPVSVLAMPHGEALLGPLEPARLDGPVTGEGDARFRVGAVKLFGDGGVLPAIEGHWDGHPLSMGMVFEDLGPQVARAVERGFRVAVHAIGNRGASSALEAFESVSRRRPDDDHRWRLEHATLLGSSEVQRMAELGVVAVVQPGFLHHMGGAVDGFELEDATWLPFGDLGRSGIPLAGSSDLPCAFYEPLLTSARGVTRITSKGSVLDAGQSLPYETWLQAYTAGAAFAGGQEHERGTIKPGLQADLVVLEGDLDADRPPEVVQTWVAGRRVHPDTAHR